MYASDLTDAQWAKLEALLREPATDRHAGGRPRKYPLRRVTEAVLYVVKTGCQWRQMPVDFPPWQTVYQQFRSWRLRGTWERVVKCLRGNHHRGSGRPGIEVIFEIVGADGGVSDSVAVGNRISRARVPALVRDPAMREIGEGLNKEEENGET